ncbi:non-ribosomal peptide synthase/polyketide synthase [Xanthomonas translucens pv. undulosa]|uniref:non-ribosomal peptide synthase/polyketide synthase n=1 Tax=Xanthomonas campestris pv. translucens TaxID=343 RepID=UPI0019D6CE77|nr:non-ribosomal peptide synthase/polyketide synthase [Xanthomonas translucens]QSQ54056.1 non-ribosomal peptide synthase/polyketide synthase [Xanthomonas translucens pv. undulosa]QSQ60323.1 non-ribosomal peptide synthase/polyketide synthase [Xanthomonas translucens pv. undulosa]
MTNPVHPLSSAQQGVWLGQLLAPDQPSYTIGCVMHFEGNLRREIWEQAVAAVVARHDALRTVLLEGSPLPSQRVLEHLPFALPWHDYSADADGEQRVREHIQQAMTRSLAQYGQPLWDIQWLQASATRGYCLYLCHHLIADGVSMGMLARQVVDCYNQCLRGEPDQSPAPSYLQALDVDVAYIGSSRYQRDLAYWRTCLNMRPEPLHPAATVALGHQPSVQLKCVLDTPVFLGLSTLAERLGGSFTSLIVACLANCLARLGNHQAPIAIGLAIHNRHNRIERAMFGMLSTQLPLYLAAAPRADIATAMRSIAAQLRTAMRHARFPLQHALRELGEAGQLAPRPFDVSVSVEDFSAFGDAPIADGAWHMLPLHAGYEDTALGVFVRRYSPQHPTVLEFNVNPDRLPVPLAEQALAALRQILLALLDEPHAPLSRLPLLTSSQREQVLYTFNDCAGQPPRDRQVHHAFERQAAATPNAIALVCDGDMLDYAALEAQANQLAHHLCTLGVAPDERVAICLPRGIAMVVAALATLKAGAAYVPLDPAYPAERQAYMLQDCQARVLLTTTAAAAALALPADLIVLYADAAPAAWHGLPTTPPARAGSPQHAAYVIYTSGSTGRPKGVVMPHGPLLNLLQWEAGHCAGAELHALRTLQFSALGFDASFQEIFSTLGTGGTLVLIDDTQRRDAHALYRHVCTQRIERLYMPYIALQSLAETVLADPALDALDCQLRKVLTAGEQLRITPAIRAFFARRSACRLHNYYGPTETHVASAHLLPADSATWPLLPSIGSALPDTPLYVLDAGRQPLPVGATGELYIAGVQVARGYLHRPALTAERFVPDPFATQPGQRMYRTGDLARWRADGEMEFLGRNDDQVKLRGFRIEPGEIEAALQACPGVREAAVLLREDRPGDKRLVAYLVGAGLQVEHLRDRLAAHLPDYMVPTAYVVLPAIPTTSHGKLDRQALPAPDATALAVSDYAAPEGELETRLATLWCELLGVERVGRHDSFFALGGHSLLGVQLIARIRSALGLELPLATLFARPRLAELALALAHAAPSGLPAIVPVPHPEPLPLSFAQQRLWVLAQFDARADLAYLMPGTVALRGALDVAALQQALDRILARHEALRTRFVATEDGAAQVIDPVEMGVPLEYIDLRHASDPQAAAQRHAEQETTLVFDLARGPLLRARLLQRAEDDHLLLVTLHHLVADGWSIGVLLHELGALYSAFAQGQPDPLPPLPIQYADYTLWQRRWIDATLLQRQRQFWLDHLGDAPARLALPTDRPRPPEQDYAGAAIAVTLDAARTRALIALSQRHGATLFMTLLAAWGALLARLAGQDQVVIGTPIAQRTRAETASLIGLLVNTQALHLDLRADPSVAELLAQVRATALAAQAHQDLPFEQLIEALNPVRSLAYSPVFQVMFTWQNTPHVELAMSGLRSDVLPGPARDAKYDLDLDLRLEGGCIVGSLRFATALFDADTIQRQWDSFDVLLDGILGDAQARVSRLPLLAPAQQQQQLQAFHAGDRAGDTSAADPCTVAQWFARQASATPQAIALVCGDATLSYQQLDCRSNQLALRLIALGARPDRCVALCLPRGITQIVAVLAVLKAGAAYLPLEPSQPDERLAAVLADAQPVLLLVDELERAAFVGNQSTPVQTIAALQAAASNDPEHAATVPPPHPQQLAYVIYTSGSTGRPKGVMVAHHGLSVRLQDLIHTYGLGPQDRVLQFATLAFDASVEELFGALCSGASLVLRDDGWLDIERFWTRCAQAGISVIDLPTRFWADLCAQSLDIPTCVRQVIVGGEALTPAMRQRWLQGARTPLLDTYGPTEAIVVASAQAVAADAPIGIGHPLSATRAYVLDRAGHALPIGACGELHLSGVALARGYLGRPDLTAERFVPDPFADQPGQRMYKSGDLACWRADGTLDFLGRNDRQLKLRGFRIELGEIESALRGCAGIDDALVLAREDRHDAHQLVAYLIGQDIAVSSVHATLSDRLPDYMLPVAYAVLASWPLTASGKLDRAALPDPHAQAFNAQAYAAPEGELEATLAALWSELLGVERVGRRDSFFALGGHSLLALRLISRIRSTLGLELTLAALFAQPRLAEMAQALPSTAASQLPAIVPLPREGDLPLSFAQQRLWFLAQLDAQADLAYAMPGGVELHGALDLAALRQALDRIVARHEALRTTFVASGDSAIQRIAPAEVGFALDCIDLRHAHDPDADAQRLAEQEANTPFDLEHGPLIRGRLLRLAEHRHRLLVTMHHIVTDGWSIGLLLRELGALYAAFVQGQPDPVPPLSIQYADYTLWQRRWLDGPLLQRQLDFWRDHLEGAPTLLALPTDHPRPALQDYRGDSVDLTLDADLTEALTALSQRHGTTLFMTVLAAWGALLARLSGQDEAVIGTPIANRTCSELEPLIGFFVNTQALRIDLRGNPSVAELLAQVRSTALVAQDHQDLPFEQVIEALNPARHLGHHPVFQAMLVWQNNVDVALDLPGLHSRVLEQDNATAKFDLQLTLQVQDAHIAGQLTYATALFERDTIERHLAQFVALLRGIVADDNIRVDRLPLSSALERQQWLHILARQHTTFDDARCLPAVFEQQVARTPQAIALVDGLRELSYAELDTRANRLAHHLIAHGVGPEDRVALFLQRGIDLVVAILAVLKAGAAYLPMDPAYPAERLAFMLDDAQPRLLLADRELAAALPTDARIATVWMDAEADAWAQQPAHAPQRSDLLPQHPAYVIYTSGSTGTPKGVVVAHAQVVRLLHATRTCVAPTAGDVWTLFHSCAFDFSVWELWGALAHGGRLVVVPQHTARDPAAFHALLCQQRVSVLNQTPSAFQALLDAQRHSDLQHNLRLVIFGGEALQPATLAPWFAQHGQRTALINMYGITETTVHVTAHALTPQDAQRAGQSLIGAPLADLRAYVLASDGQSLPIGVAGELHVAGAGLARGYLGRPGLTAERFVPDPFAEHHGERMYKTGDLARWRADGSLEYLGRNDEQVKLRGFRIELGEIQAALRSCEGVRQAAVVVREDNTGDKRLVAYVVGDDEVVLNAEALRTQLGARLPDYMLPAAYVPLAALPLTANGKLDRRALPAPDADALATQAYVAPEDEREILLADLWHELLGVERVGRYDNFFALGGHSLLAVRLISRIRTSLGLELPLATVFAQPRLADLAQALDSVAASALPAIVPADRGQPPPLSFAQQRLWFLGQLDAQADLAYLMPNGLRLHGTLDRQALRQALDRIVARHATLRTRIALHQNEPVQIIDADNVGFRLCEHDLGTSPDPEAQARIHAEQETQTPFDLAHDTLARGQLLRLGEDDHVLLVTLHHLVSDGWSMSLLVRELSTLYAAFALGQPDPLPPLQLQYADIAVWQRRWIGGQILQRQRDFWVKHLHDAPPLLELPTDRARPPRQDYRGAMVDFVLDAELTAALKTLSQHHGATLFMTLFAAWGVLLSRLSGQDQVVIGTPVANRHRSEFEPLIGLFVNTQALRIDMRGNPSLAELLAQVRANALAAQEHQDLPFEQVIEALNPERGLSHHPVFQVMFVWQNTPDRDIVLPGLELHPMQQTLAVGKFDLDVTLEERHGCIVGSLGYATALFDRSSIDRHLAQFVTLLRGMLVDDSVRVGRLPLLPAGEHTQLQGFNVTANDLGGTGYLHRQIEAQVQRTPQAIAVVEAHVELTYAELDARANRLAHHLIALGVAPEDRVALCLPRSLDLIVALLAVLKAGGAYLPLETDAPPARLDGMLADARPSVLLTRRDTAATLAPRDDLHTVLLDAEPAAWTSAPAHAPIVTALHPEHPAYVIYTSGSTGKPKGVVNTHAAIDNRLQWMQQKLQLQPEQRVLQKTPVGFDVSVWELFWPLRVGARLVLAEPGGHKDPAYLTDLIEQAGIDTVHFVPSMLRAFLEALPDGACASLRRIVCSGEALPADLAREARERLPQARLYNLYGPTEAAVDVSVWECTAADTHSVPIGRPIANTQLHVLDAQRQRSPIGVAGELQIAGVQLARGYLGRPDLTAERFVPDPFAEQPGQRMYRTGDVSRWRADGALEYLGRNDHQVKLRGVRIELGEIEAALRGCDGVREAVVIARDDTGEQRLIAYLVGDAKHLAADALRTQLAARLPEVMLPSGHVWLDALPLTANGKLDRRALPAPDADARAVQAYAPPEGELEPLLATLWSELLGVEQIGRHDSFFALGGHSLLAVRLISRIRTSLGLELPLATLFAQPRLADLAQALLHAATSTLPPIVPADRSKPLPLSFTQQRLWFLAQLDVQADLAYLMPNGLRLHGQLDRHALRQALDRIVARHETLRTRIALHNDEPVQLIAADNVGFPLREHDLSACADPERQAQHHAEQETQTPFDLARDTLARGQLLRLGEDDHVLLVTLHHLVSDGWSMDLLVRELSTLYAAFALGQPDPLPPLPLQYADIAVWQRRWISGQILQRQREFWVEHLHDAPTLLALPSDRPRPALQDSRGDMVAFALDTELSAALKALSERHGTTLFMTVLSAWSVLLARTSGQDQVVIGTPVANRHRSEFEPLIGLFVNTQALRIDLRSNSSVAELLAQVRATALAAQDHQDLPFEQVIEALNPERSLAHHPVFQVMFAWQNAASADLTLPGIRLQPLQSQGHNAKFDLELFLGEDENQDCIVGSLGYATALFDRSSIERHLAQFVALLRGMVSAEPAHIAQLPLLPPTERAQLQRFNATESDLADSGYLHRQIQAQAQRTPQAIALVDGEVELTYAALEARANQLAHHLIHLGVVAEERVAVCLPRGVDLVVALLAVLKAGGAYVPLDPVYPPARLDFMLQDSAARCLLTHTALADLLPGNQLARVWMDDTASWAMHPVHTPAVQDVSPHHLAYVIYTSGSTGHPKGVMISHHALTQFLAALQIQLPLSPEDRLLAVTTVCFDIAGLELFAPLVHGARVVIAGDQAIQDPAYWSQLLDWHAISVLQATPAFWQMLLDAGWQSRPGLRLLCGGEALSQELAQRLRIGGGQLCNLYGPTEATIWASLHPVLGDDTGNVVPLGRPLTNTQLWVLDTSHQLVPLGVAGELYIAGPQLARGYLARPDLTAERFVPDPFAEHPGERMYRTGDLARWHADGVLESLGRNDAQVKIRGFRIELGEIEAALRACDGVRQAAVVVREDNGDKRLIAYLVVDDEVILNADALHTQLSARLPDYMLPAAYVQLAALPLTANGKLDRRALPAPDADAIATQAYVAPEGEREALLADLWHELLGVERVGRHDNFFALGGHSLLAVRLISRIRTSLGLELPLAALFAHPRLADLAQALDSAAASTLPAIVPADRGQPLPLSFAQQRLWFLAQLDAQADLAYLMPNGLRLHGKLDRHALRHALDRIVARHETLRTRIGLHQGEPVQIIDAADVGFPCSDHDLSTSPDPEAQARIHAEQETQTPFDLTHDTLARGQLLRLGEDDHVLLITLHHLVSDGWSMGLLVRELSTLYAAFAQGIPDPLPPLPLQYADIAVWQRRWISGEVLQRQREFWVERLHDAPTLLALPADRPRPALQDSRGDIVTFALDTELSAALKALSERHGTTLFMTVLSAWSVLLARLSGQDQVVIGSPVANRHRSEFEPLIGLFVNTQALRIDLRGNPSLADLLAKVRANALAAQDHQDLPFEQVIEALNPERSLAHHPVFQVMFAWQNAASADLTLSDIRLQPLQSQGHNAKFDLELFLGEDEHQDRIVGSLGYATALFDRSSIDRHLAQFVTLLRGMLAGDSVRVGRLPLLPAGEHTQLQGFNVTANDLGGTGYLHRQIEAQVQRTPQAIAVVEAHVELTYAELDARANRLAHHLIALGVAPEDRVALCLPRSLDLIVALLAVLKAGAAYLPLDSDVPPARLDTMLADARPRVLLAHRETAALLAQCADRHSVLLDADAALWATTSTQAPTVALHPQHPAYVIYTSGSTGKPKGVVNTHAAIDNRLQWMQQKLQLQPEQRVLQKTPVGFDVSVWELFWPLRVGARLVLAEPGGHKDPAYLTDLIEQAGIDTVHFVPSMLRAFLEALPDGACASLRRIVCSGEALPADLAYAALERLPQARLYNLYGPTEAAVDVSVWECTAADTHSVPIGRPIANTQLHVIDAQRQRSPIGVAGELQIAGVQLARGYLGRPDLTAERFVPDPFAEQPGQRMYRTGDVARWRADGALEYLGRNDHQVKLRGVRIELGEIEAALRGCDGVREAVVIARDDTGEQRLIAYLVGDTLAVTPALLRTQLRTRLPDYMLPAAYVQLDALPLTPNGKLDSRALPAPDDQALDLHLYVPPQGELEHVMAALWSELLGVEQVGRNDDFFALGGHSLLAIKLIERLRRLGWHLDVRSLFSTPTLASLAAELAAASDVIVPPNRIGPACTRITPDLLPLVELTQAEIDAIVATVAGGVSNVQDIYPLASLQEGLLFHHLANPLADPYLHSVLLSFPSRDQLDAFLDALDQVVARHDMLRTGFAWQGLPAPVQVVWRQASLARRLHVFDGPDPAAELQAWMHAPAAALSVQHAPLIHAHLADDHAAGRWLLGLQHHHLVMDHTTLELVIEEVQAHLSGSQLHLPAPLPFRDFIAHARSGMSEQDHQAFFTEMLGDIDTPTAPFGALAPVHGPAALQRIQRPLPAALANTLRAQARRHGVSVASIFHLAYALLLARSSGRDEAVFGTVLFGRMHASAGVDRVLGMFLNTLPIRLGGAHDNVLQAVRHTQLCLARLLHHEHAPLALAQRCSAVDPTLPLLNAMLNYRYAGGSNVLDDEAHPHHDALREVQQLGGQERTHYPLAVSVDDRIADGGFHLDVQCVEQIGSERVAALLLQTLEALVHALEHMPETALHALDLLPAEECAQLQRFNATATDLDGTGYLHRAIEAQTQRTPDAIAVADDHGMLSYADLDARTNQLAHHLIGLGVVPESSVAVCLPRSIDLVVALLAILKAGAAYLPLDSDVPAARLDTMLADARPRVLLAHRQTAALLTSRDDRHSVLLDADAALWACASTQAPTVALHPQHPAYIIYTSGSTGTPKGVVNTHAGIDNRLQWGQQAMDLQPEQRVLQKTPVGFDVSVWELFWPLRVGARLVLAQPGGHKDPAYLIDLIEQAGVDTVHFVPSMLRAFLDALPDGGCANLRRIVCSGEALPADLAHAARERLPQARLYNLYGPTEAAVEVSVWECTDIDTDASGVSMGRPIANTQLHVLDAQRQRSLIGVPGELQIAGVQLARGYLGRPDLTAERFVPDPFAEQPGQRMYRTGDLARWRADGALDYLGRNDDQVKLRGVRIELGEIEIALRGCAGVREAAVVARDDLPGDTRLVAYVVGDDDAVSADTLRTQLAARLPDVMVPATYMQLDSLPLSSNGKLDRRALPVPEADALATQLYVPPEGELETLLAALWCELLGLERVGRQDNFFALGGHSLLTVRLSAAIRRDLQCDVPIQSLFAQPTLQQMAYLVLSTRLEQLQAADAADFLSKAKLER